MSWIEQTNKCLDFSGIIVDRARAERFFEWFIPHFFGDNCNWSGYTFSQNSDSIEIKSRGTPTVRMFSTYLVITDCGTECKIDAIREFLNILT